MNKPAKSKNLFIDIKSLIEESKQQVAVAINSTMTMLYERTAIVAIELKLGKFQAAYKGQMELYLRWLDKNMKVDGENTPIGLILCAGKNEPLLPTPQTEDGL